MLRVRTSRKLSMCQFMRLSLYNLTDQDNLDALRSRNCIVIIDFALSTYYGLGLGGYGRFSLKLKAMQNV